MSVSRTQPVRNCLIMTGIVAGELLLAAANPAAVHAQTTGETGKPDSGATVRQPEEPDQPLRQVRRAPRPDFAPGQPASSFFDDLFTEALLGPRPRSGDAAPPAMAGVPAAVDPVTGGDSSGSWSSVISATVLEDEIKRQQIRLNTLVTNPVQFQTRNTEIGESFEILAAMFGIVSQYQDSVRWQEEAEAAVAVLVSAAAKTRTTDLPAFEFSQSTTQRLTDLIRGGSFSEEPNAKPVTDWSMVIDRNTLMSRLERNVSETLKEATSTPQSFSRDAENVVHEAALIAALGRILQRPDMLDADDEDYTAIAEEMVVAAQALSAAAEAADHDAAVQSLNRINRSCINCHAEWR